jgi:hypothetical protein
MKIAQKILILIYALALMPSCADYLNVVPDNTLSL